MRKPKSAALIAAVALAVALTAAPAASASPSQFKDTCKDQGYLELGFSNQGQCVSFANELDRAVSVLIAECTDLVHPSDACITAVQEIEDMLAALPPNVAITFLSGNILNIIRIIGGGGGLG